MRATASTTLLLFLGLLAPAASARPRKPTAKPAATHNRASAHAKAPSARRGRAAQAKRTSVNPPPTPPLPPIHVTHDRKHHLRPAPTATPVRSTRASRRLARLVVPVTPRAEIVAHPRILADSPALIMPVLEYPRGRLILPPALKGSHEILLRQNEIADRDGLMRVQDDADLLSLRDRGMLVPIPVSAGLRVDERLPYDRRYTRPWTAAFLATLARAHYARFRAPLQVNSAVRTVEFQQRLLRTNGNAAPADGDTASPHLTGQAVDLAKHGLSLSEIAWLRAFLLQLTQEGKIDVEEEFQQSCFHISVYKKYLPLPADKRVIIPVRNTVDTLAAAVPVH